MRSIKNFVCGFAVVAIAASAGTAYGEIPWMNDLASAKLAASQQNRLVLVHFYGDGCAPCERVEKNVFPRPEVEQAISHNFVPVMVNATRRPDLARQFGVRSWPTDVILTPSGQVVSQGNSPQDPTKYVAMVQQAVHQSQPGGNDYAQPAQYAANYPPGQQQPPGGQFGAAPTQYQPPGGQFGAAPNQYSQPAQPPGGQFPGAGAPPGNPLTAAQQGGPNPYRYDPRGAEMATRRDAAWPPQGGAQPTNPGFQSPAQGGFQGASQANYAPAYGGGQFGAPANNPGYQNPPGQPAGPGMQHQQPQPGIASNPYAAASQGPITGGPPPGQSPLCMDGYCPVSLVDGGAWKKADPRWGVIHKRRTYQFAGQAEQQKFLNDPDKYAPALSGYDPVIFQRERRLVGGERKHGVFFEEHIYLFSSEESLEEFRQSAKDYAAAAQQAMKDNVLGPVMR